MTDRASLPKRASAGLVVALCTIACQPSRAPDRHGPFGVEELARLDDFAAVFEDLVVTGDGRLLASLVTQAAPAAERRASATLLSVSGERQELWSTVANLRTGALGQSATGTVVFTEDAAPTDDWRAPVHLRQLDLAGRSLAPPRRMGGAALNVPTRQRVLLAADGTAYLAMVSEDFELVLVIATADGDPMRVPLASRKFMDSSTYLAFAPDGGVLIAMYLDADDAAGRTRLGIPAAGHDGTQIALVSLTASGAVRQAVAVATAARAYPAALHITPGSVFVAGKVHYGTNERAGFVSRFDLGPAGELSPRQTLEFRHPENVRSMGDILVLADGRILVAGEVGGEQATTGSVIGSSRAALFLLDAGLNGPPLVQQYGEGSRRNGFGRLLIQDGRILGTAWLDGPKTHDADADPAQAYAHAALVEIRIP